MEDNLLKYFPEQIEQNKGFIKGLEADMATLAAHPHPEDGFAGMEVRGDHLIDKENAGAALMDVCKEVKSHGCGVAAGHHPADQVCNTGQSLSIIRLSAKDERCEPPAFFTYPVCNT